MADVGDELALERGDPALLLGDEHDGDRADDDDDAREAHHRDLEQAAVLDA